MNRHTSPSAGPVGQKTRSVVDRPDRRRLLRLAAAAPLMPLIAGVYPDARRPAPRRRGGSGDGTRHPERTLLAGQASRGDGAGGDRGARAGTRRPGCNRPYAAGLFPGVSGGGDDGAFGAGLLCGWHDAGTIPTFKLVTGVSTGSMIAPFAFLGGPYYDRLRTMYTTITPSDISKNSGAFGLVFGDALADTTPLYNLISRYLDERMFADIADAYRKVVVADRHHEPGPATPVIWNIGAIAASSRPGALEVVRKILLVSAAVPGTFPPVMMDVEAGGGRYQEMNVDGGAVAQTFLYPPEYSTCGEYPVSRICPRTSRLYHPQRPARSGLGGSRASKFADIAGRAISTMIYYSGYNDIIRIYATTKRDGVDYNLAYIGTDFPEIKHEQFDPVYMKRLFDYGYVKGRAGYPWSKERPILDVRT